jgi:hypothetical protein
VLPEVWKLSKEDLSLFFDIDNISIEEPNIFGRSFKVKIKHEHPIGEINSLNFYEYTDVCIRCSPKRNYGTHLCQKCLSYLNEHYGKKLPLI